jgi:hypothetical protein
MEQNIDTKMFTNTKTERKDKFTVEGRWQDSGNFDVGSIYVIDSSEFNMDSQKFEIILRSAKIDDI